MPINSKASPCLFFSANSLRVSPDQTLVIVNAVNIEKDPEKLIAREFKQMNQCAALAQSAEG